MKSATKRKRKAAGKGSAFERSVCKKLSLWVSGDKDEDLFWRSSISGGRATQSLKRGRPLARQAGDICAISPEGHKLTNTYFIECKHWRDLEVLSFILKGQGKLARFWMKAWNEAIQHEKRPLLIAKQNNWPTLMITQVNDMPCNTVLTVHGARCDIAFFDDLLAIDFRDLRL